MGCIFSRKQALSFKKKRKIPQREERYVPRYGAPLIRKPSVSNVQAHSLPSTSEMPCRQIFENIRQEYSTLAFLMGGKTFPDEELVLANKSHEAIANDEKKTDLPGCVIYEGLHEFGFHLFTIDTELYSNSVETSDFIPDSISALTGEGRCVVVYKHHLLQPAYLPNQSAYARELFNSLCTRLGDRLERIVFHNPSWYCQVCLDIQSRTGRHFFSQAAMGKLKFTMDIVQLAKMTGFPGEIRLH